MANIKKKISELKFDSSNINKGTEYGMSLLEKSLREVGAGRSILLDKNFAVVAGNKTLEKAGELGFEDVIIIPTDGKTLVAVQRMDIDINSADGAKMKILDNTVSRHNYIEDVEIAEAICEEYMIESTVYGLATYLTEPDDDELTATERRKPFAMKITFQSEDELRAAESEINELLEAKYPNAMYSVSGGEL